MPRRVPRRDVIRGIGVTGIVAIAGCSGNGDGGTETPTDTPADGGDGGDGTPTDTPADGGDGTATDTPADGGTTTQAPSGRTIQLGMAMGVTGGLESLGPPIRDAAQIVPEQVNQADTPYEVDVQFEDTGTNPSQGVSVAESLVNAGYPGICGALSSEVSLQIAQQVAIPSGVTMCSPASTAPDFTTLEDDDYFFRTPPTDALQGAILAQIAAERLEHSTAASLYLNNTYGQGLNNGFVDSFENEYGGDVLNEVSFAPEQNSYTSQLQSVLQGDPGVLLITGYPDSGVQIFRDYYSSFDRGDGDVLVPDGLQSSSLPGSVGYDMSNVRGTAPSGEGPGLDFFLTTFEDMYGETAEGQPFTKQAYDAAAALVLANAAGGENTGSAVRDNMRPVTESGTTITPENLPQGVEQAAAGEDINYQGVSGPVAFDEAGDLGSAAYVYFHYTQDGGMETLDTITP